MGAIYQNQKTEIKKIIANAIKEDIGKGDFTSMACLSKNLTGKTQLIAKSNGIIAGVDFAHQVFNFFQKTIFFTKFIQDGDSVNHGDIIFEVKANVSILLKAERIILNVMQRMSAIATETKRYVSLLKGTKVKLLDTRKTTPNIRILEKWAVIIGGGNNHRMGLYDMILLKDNHIDFCGGVINAIEKTKKYIEKNQLKLKIIVEIRTLKELKLILNHKGIYRVLIDNFSIAQTKKAVQLAKGIFSIEASGNITHKNIRKIAACGVDYISTGAIMHSAKNIDLSLKAVF